MAKTAEHKNDIDRALFAEFQAEWSVYGDKLLRAACNFDGSLLRTALLQATAVAFHSLGLLWQPRLGRPPLTFISPPSEEGPALATALVLIRGLEYATEYRIDYQARVAGKPAHKQVAQAMRRLQDACRMLQFWNKPAPAL